MAEGGRSVLFNIKCSDGVVQPFLHVPGDTCWRYLQNLILSGLAENETYELDLSDKLPSASIKLLARIFGSGLPITAIRTFIGSDRTREIYYNASDSEFTPRITTQDFADMVECIAYCEVLDIRYYGFENIETQSVQAAKNEWITTREQEKLVHGNTMDTYLDPHSWTWQPLPGPPAQSFAAECDHYLPVVFLAALADLYYSTDVTLRPLKKESIQNALNKCDAANLNHLLARWCDYSSDDN